MSTTAAKADFKVADLGLAEFGRNEIRLAEHEMPGLMAVRREYSEAQPLAGAVARVCSIKRPVCRLLIRRIPASASAP